MCVHVSSYIKTDFPGCAVIAIRTWNVHAYKTCIMMYKCMVGHSSWNGMAISNGCLRISVFANLV